MSSLKVNASFPPSNFEIRGLVKLGIFYVEYLALYSWWSSLSGKLPVYGRIELVLDMAPYAKRKIRPKTLCVTKFFLYFS